MQVVLCRDVRTWMPATALWTNTVRVEFPEVNVRPTRMAATLRLAAELTLASRVPGVDLRPLEEAGALRIEMEMKKPVRDVVLRDELDHVTLRGMDALWTDVDWRAAVERSFVCRRDTDLAVVTVQVTPNEASKTAAVHAHAAYYTYSLSNELRAL